MSGGLDILIVGIADKNLDGVASEERLRELFDNYPDTKRGTDRRYRDFHALIYDPSTKKPKICYLFGEHMLGVPVGAGLGYVIFDGNNNSLPKRVDERVFARIPELQANFVKELEKNGLSVPDGKVGVYALNVYDT